MKRFFLLLSILALSLSLSAQNTTDSLHITSKKELATTFPDEPVKTEEVKKITPIKRKGFVGVRMGVSKQSDSKHSGYSNLKSNFNVLNLGFLSNHYIGMAVIISPNFSLFLGPMLSFPMGEIVNFDLRVLPGLSTLSRLHQDPHTEHFHKSTFNIAFDLGASFRFHASPHIDVSLNGDFIVSDITLRDRFKMFSAGIGIAYRLR